MKQWRLMIAVSMALLAGSVSAETPRDVNFVGSTSQIQQGNQAAIVVGVEDYDERLTGFRQLDYSADDAHLIGSALRSIGYSAQQIDILTDTKASKSVVLNRIRQRAKALGKDGTLLFFFSGHGLGRDDENYLATYGAVANDLVRDGLAVRDVVAAIHESGVRRAVLLLDACRNDPTPGSKSANVGFTAVNAGEGIQILLSTGRGEVSWEHPDLKHGVFSYFLANGLRGGKQQFSQLADYVEREVTAWTVSRKVQTQKPFRSGEHRGGDFLLVSAATPSTPQPEPAPEPPPVTRPEPVQVQPAPTPSTSKAIEPEMVNIPAGTFTMGCVDGRDNVEGVDKCPDYEKPAHEVSISAFQLAATDVTFDQWDACEAAKVCPHADDKGWGRGNRPVINVSWNDAKTYLQWLSKESGKDYRLPSEAEWEYAARAGTATAYPWGSKASHAFANYGKDVCCEGLVSGKDQWVNTSPVGSFAANPFGLYDMNGNVYQWVEDCFVSGYMDASADGSARQGCGANASRVLRGGSWSNIPQGLRSATRNYNTPAHRGTNVGFRAARTL